MKAKLTLKSLKIKGDFNKTFEKVLETQIRQAARAWLLAVMERVPVYTGMAKGSLIPLGQYLHVAIPINRNPSADAHGYSWRSESDGAPLGRFKFERRGTHISFSFSTDVRHYNINEYYDPRPDIHLISPVPWKSWEAGKRAFFNYLEQNLPHKLPKLKNYIELSNVSGVLNE